MAPFYEQLVEPQQYVATIAGGRAETFGSRYVFSFIDRSTISTAYRLGFTLRPDMNLDVYAEPFASSGHYYDFGELLAASGRDRLQYGTGGTTIAVQPDGSRAVTAGGAAFTLNVRRLQRAFVSQQRRAAVGVASGQHAVRGVAGGIGRGSALLGTHVGVGDMFRSLTVPGSHFFVVKTSFWLPIK
jgi:hypothetical protein